MGVLKVLLLIIPAIFGADNRKFPPDFKFGVATASYQIEGAWNEDGKGENIWDDFIHHNPEMVQDRTNGDIACDSYHKYKEDIALIKDLKVDFYRLSISWSRILPTGYINGGINKAGVAYYNKLFNGLIKNKIEPIVTLYHWDLPQPLQKDFGGWLNETIVEVFANYSRVIFDLFGDRVKNWMTFNEPNIFCVYGYEGGEKGLATTNHLGVDIYTCGHMILKSHAAAYRIYEKEYKEKQKGKISMAFNSDWMEPSSTRCKDVKAAERNLQFRFGWFAHPLVYGDYPKTMINRIGKRSKKEGYPKSRLPKFTQKEIDNIKGTYDYIGLNHYSTSMVQWIKELPIGEPNLYKDISVKPYHKTSWENSATPWLKVVPWGLRKLCNWIKVTYNNPEIIITENGFSDQGGILNDTRRINYHREYLSSVLEAIHDDNVNVTGYTVWSLMDNFGWLSGYTEHFGLYSVNFTNPDRPRTPKASVAYFKKVVATKCLVDNCSK